MKCVIVLVFGMLTVAVKTGGEGLVLPHILGGKDERHLDFPYSVRLRQSKRNESYYKYCGAARLNKLWFVTAAECLDKETYNLVQITYPEENHGHDFNSRLLDYRWQNEVVIHPKYNKVNKQNNIGLLKCFFCGEVRDQNALPRLPKKSERNESFSSYKAIVSGWTINNPTAEHQGKDMIQSYETRMVGSSLCKLAYFFRSVSSELICASSWGGKRITEAHIGVPLVVKEGSGTGSALKLIGIAASLQPWTTILPVPTVFTNIAPYAEWISQTTNISWE